MHYRLLFFSLLAFFSGMEASAEKKRKRKHKKVATSLVTVHNKTEYDAEVWYRLKTISLVKNGEEINKVVTRSFSPREKLLSGKSTSFRISTLRVTNPDNSTLSIRRRVCVFSNIFCDGDGRKIITTPIRNMKKPILDLCPKPSN